VLHALSAAGVLIALAFFLCPATAPITPGPAITPGPD